MKFVYLTLAFFFINTAIAAQEAADESELRLQKNIPHVLEEENDFSLFAAYPTNGSVCDKFFYIVDFLARVSNPSLAKFVDEMEEEIERRCREKRK